MVSGPASTPNRAAPRPSSPPAPAPRPVTVRETRRASRAVRALPPTLWLCFFSTIIALRRAAGAAALLAEAAPARGRNGPLWSPRGAQKFPGRRVWEGGGGDYNNHGPAPPALTADSRG